MSLSRVCEENGARICGTYARMRERGEKKKIVHFSHEFLRSILYAVYSHISLSISVCKESCGEKSKQGKSPLGQLSDAVIDSLFFSLEISFCSSYPV